MSAIHAKSFYVLCFLASVLTPLSHVWGEERVTVRVGYFPNVTHAQALVAVQLARQGKPWFEPRLGAGVQLQWFVFNAGPSAMEAIAARSIDLTYVGPNPALNLYVKSEGQDVRVISGSAKGGAALVVQPDERLLKPQDFRDKLIATPELGNTQDIACRAWLKTQGFRITQMGGDVKVLPTANPDQLALFISRKIDGAWTVEPWVSRLELEAKGKIYREDKDSITTVVVASARFARVNSALVRKFVEAQAELTAWINAHPEEAKELVNAELKRITNHEMPRELIDRAWSRLQFTNVIRQEDFAAFVAQAQSVGFLRGPVDLTKFTALP